MSKRHDSPPNAVAPGGSGRQLDLPLTPKLRVIDGLGQKKTEPLLTRDAVARVLMEAGADLLLRRISHERAEVIEKQVDEILELFDRVDDNRLLFPVLQKKLDALEALMQETREKRGRPKTASPPGAVAPRGSARR